MGLIVWVLRAPGLGDTTNGGVSALADRLCVVNVPGPFVPTADMPAVMLTEGPGGTKRLVPAVRVGETGWQEGDPEGPSGRVGQMAGGNFATSSDSRWSAAVGFYGAVAIHDRYESAELNELLSR